MTSGRLVAAAILAVVAFAALYFFAPSGEEAPAVAGGTINRPNEVVIRANSDRSADSPFAASSDLTVEPETEPVDTLAGSAGAASEDSAAGDLRSRVAPLEGDVDVTTLGRSELDDDAFEALAARLASDPELMAALIDEFRSESDPERLARLVILLGEVGGPEATALAAEMVYSSDPELRERGLELLRRVQPGNGEARDIVAGLLSNATDRDTIVPVLQTLTRPGVVPADERAELAAQVSLLSMHEDPGVRRLGLNVLGRWSEGSENLTLFREGLADTHTGVREAAAYALVGRPDADGALTAELFAVADSAGEDTGVRRAAILALKNLPLSAADVERRLAIELVLDRRPLR